jgi:hypothetical protein
MKLKHSSIFLIGITLFVIGGIVTSSFMLRKKYDSLNTANDPQWYYTKLTDAPFKHLKITQNAKPDSLKSTQKEEVQGVWGALSFMESNTFSVASNPSSMGYDIDTENADTISCKIIGDTLVINVPYHQFYYKDNYRRMSFDLRLKMPNLESLSCDNTSPYILNFNQDKLDIVLTKQAHVIFEDKDIAGKDKVKNMSYVKAHINDKAVLDLSRITQIKTLDIDLKDRSKILMPILAADKLTLRADDSTRIAAPSHLFKQGIEK